MAKRNIGEDLRPPSYAEYREWGHAPFAAFVLSRPFWQILAFSAVTGLILAVLTKGHF